MFRRVLLTLLAITLVPAFGWSAQAVPVAVSPGSGSGLQLVSDACTTFSWAATEKAQGFSINVYEVTEAGQLGQTVIRQALPSGASSWTLPLGRCLARGMTYAWTVGETAKDGVLTWSEAVVFKVPAGPSETEFEEALAVVRAYLEKAPQGADDAQGSQRQLTQTGSDSRSLAASPQAAPAATKLSVDGNIDAVSFTGDGSNLAGVATDTELTTHEEVADAHFDHAGTLAELNTQVGASVADGPHTLNTTCLDGSVDCAFAASTIEGGAALSGDSATGFFSTGQIEEPRIADEIARDAELAPGSTAVAKLLLCANQNRGGWRYWDLGDGTVLDCNTGLIWLRNANCFGTRSWDQAESDSAGLEEGECGLTDGSSPGDWRQPTISELCSSGPAVGICPSVNAPDSLIDSSQPGDPKVVNANGDGRWTPDDPFVGVQSYNYWSATERDTVDAWDVDLFDGGVFFGTKGNAFYVWPVRGGL